VKLGRSLKKYKISSIILRNCSGREHVGLHPNNQIDSLKEEGESFLDKTVKIRKISEYIIKSDDIFE
jgi:hypothetical protein